MGQCSGMSLERTRSLGLPAQAGWSGLPTFQTRMLSRKIVTWWCAFRAGLPEMSESVSPSLVVVVAGVPDDQVDPRLQRDRQRRARRRQSVTSGTT